MVPFPLFLEIIHLHVILNRQYIARLKNFFLAFFLCLQCKYTGIEFPVKKDITESLVFVSKKKKKKKN